MNFKLNSKELLQKLQFLSGIIGSNNTMPILENFLFDIQEEKITITASDLDNTLIACLKTTSIAEIKICIPAKILIDILKLLPSQEINFEIKENNQIEISSTSGNYHISYSDGAEFPKSYELENPGTFLINASTLLTAISKTLFACGQDDLRPIMNGVFFQSKNNELNFVSTDAHRMAIYTRTDIEINQPIEIVVPKKPLSVLKSVLSSVDDDITICFNENNISFTFEEFILKSRLIDGKYPNYEGVVPQENPNQFIVSKQDFQNSLSRVSIFSNKTTHQIKVQVKNNAVIIEADDKDFNTKGNETINCELIGNDIEMGFNGNFLKEALSNITHEKVIVKTSAPNRAGLIEPFEKTNEKEKLLMLVMPVMLTS